MADIVERLRALNEGNRWPMMDEAADEIERLRRDLTHYPALEASFHAANKLIEQHEDEIERLRADIRALNRELDLMAEKSRHD